VTIIEQTVHNS